MLRRKQLSVLLVIAGHLWGVSAWGQAPVTPPVQAAAPHYLVRYLCFTITPRPGALFPEAVPGMAPVLRKIGTRYGWVVPLTANPEQFLAHLRKEEPRYTYQLNLAGQSVLTPNAPSRLLGGPRPDDPHKCRVDFTMSLLSLDTAAVMQTRRNTLSLLKIDPATLIHTHMKGMYYWVSNPAHPKGTNGSGADDTQVPQGNEQILGRTNSMGMDANAAHEKTLFVYCIVLG